MMSSWRECKLGDVVTRMTSGGTPSTSKSEYYNGSIPWLNTKEIKNCRIFETEKTITDLGLKNSSAKWIDENSVIVAMYGATAGKVAINKIPLTTNQACCNITLDSTQADYNFIYYLLLNSFDRLDNMTSGAAQQNLNVGLISNFDISLPPLEEQKAIAEVLSSLDDKIDLLHRQNQTLEDLAQTLFRQWFIEEAKEEWEEKPLSLFGDIICGKTPSKSNALYFDGNVPFIKIPDMHGNTFIFKTTDTLSETGKESQKNKTLPPKSICVSCIATVGLVSMNIIESQTNQQINSIIPKKDFYRYFLYLFMKSSYDFLHTMASGGTATLNLNTGDFSKIAVLKPSDEILKSFHEIVEPIFDKIFSNQQQIQTIENIRDTLLPKLLSGEVKINLRDK